MPSTHGYVERLAELARTGAPFVSVTMVDAVGSTPQDAGSKMLVTAEGLHSGTVGGGKIENKAIGFAQEMLRADAADAPSNKLVEWNLQRDVGMTCGGVVTLYFESYNRADWRIIVFGAGHVAAAVISCLGPLHCQITCIDPRAQWLDKIPEVPGLKKIECAEPRSLVESLPSDAFVICMTMGHASDRPILEEVFRQQRRFPFLGVIGSNAKRKVLERELKAAGISADRIHEFHCPIGLPLGNNQPEEIAISVVAQLLQERDAWRAPSQA